VADPAVLAPASPALPPVEAATTGTRPRVVCLGDSLTAGYGLSAADAYPAILQRQLREAGYDFDVVNAGVSGDTSAGGLRRLDWSLRGDVRVLIVALGGNDALRGLPPGELKANLARIVETAQDRHVRVILAGMEAPPNFGPAYTREFRGVYRSLASEHRVPLIPFFLDGVAGVAALNQGDGIHPNVEGQRRVAATIWRALQPVLGARASS
jgi:acyl-CoA thioesterase-1